MGFPWLKVLAVLMSWSGLTTVSRGQTVTSTPLRIGYLAELPVSWRTGLADPVRNMSRSLGTTFARQVDPEIPLPAANVFGAESWEELERTIQLGNAEIFTLHGYELVERARTLNLKPLLLATRNGRWQTSFLLLASASSGIQDLQGLRGRTVLVHRDSCGYLVDYWLDSAIAIGTGEQRKNFARYQTVTQAREAVLPVFFGEADACVVSLAAYQSVLAQNPAQIPQRLTTLLTSKEFPSQVVACHTDFPIDKQRYVLEQTAHLTWDFGEETGTFIPAEELAFDNLRALLSERSKPLAAPLLSPVPPAAKLQSSIPARPAKRP